MVLSAVNDIGEAIVADIAGRRDGRPRLLQEEPKLRSGSARRRRQARRDTPLHVLAAVVLIPADCEVIEAIGVDVINAGDSPPLSLIEPLPVVVHDGDPLTRQQSQERDRLSR